MAELADRLRRLPGVGPRSAQRIAYHLARAPAAEVRALGEAIARLPEALGTCRVCGNLSGGDLCAICSDERRDATLLCVVEHADNLAAIERSGVYRGRYHVLGGAIAPLQSIGPEQLRIDSLIRRIREGGVEEVILATNPTVEGEATALYLARALAPLGVRVTRLATGVPVGSELEYVDKSTLAKALEGRRRLAPGE
ncbi:MAG: recombination protein RecR [Acidobacteria bacterium]|nr:MAG: recombination protein RecR [Acidobacteriota bacterium]